MSDFNVLPPPSREEVSACWKALIFGDLSRETAHGWAAPWVEGPGDTDYPDPLVLTALQFLHGFDLSVDPQHPGLVRHGQGIAWCRSIKDISDEFSRWQANCAFYDSDPQLWRQSMLRRTRSFIEAERVRNRRDDGPASPG
ncbi:hypothetical protein OG763_43120 [Streptomyces sp. NBC_01230]|uniref:hypothetical protein n=1 Tax=unclassified Streptomyces TaxID=2593676 RepID=UPI002E0FB49B|nr:hypothetical protein OG763_00070 [Streptomyces sp. NBC_01230]WSQ32059.1 hypothetical protein OG763_43120 [Streptomyces sp. NBC_01230]